MSDKIIVHYADEKLDWFIRSDKNCWTLDRAEAREFASETDAKRCLYTMSRPVPGMMARWLAVSIMTVALCGLYAAGFMMSIRIIGAIP